MVQRDTPSAAPPAAVAAGGRDRFLIGIVAGTLLLIALSVAAVFLVGRPRTPPADPASPVGVVQLYIEALREGDVARSRTYLTSLARAEAEASDRRNSAPFRPSPQRDVRIIVELISATDARAEVRVTTSRFYAGSGPFQASTSHNDTTAYLEREDGAWRITRPLEYFGIY